MTDKNDTVSAEEAESETPGQRQEMVSQHLHTRGVRRDDWYGQDQP